MIKNKFLECNDKYIRNSVYREIVFKVLFHVVSRGDISKLLYNKILISLWKMISYNGTLVHKNNLINCLELASNNNLSEKEYFSNILYKKSIKQTIKSIKKVYN